ncbi:unnamed protein product [Adineta steineri]|uniref:NHL repeat containing protein n=1 Tax=Adineta steineri TaxID=433720 RepID=A0A814S7S1_9BILA|nr:unnamed protein product [Adineta steineri]
MRIIVTFLLILVSALNVQSLFESYIQLSQLSSQFQPANSIEQLETQSVSSFMQCGYICNRNIQCRTFDYDSSSTICRVFEGALDTGLIIPAASTSRVGFIKYSSLYFIAINQPCTQCIESRYLTCSNNVCQCPIHTFYNGSQCENQRYENASCLTFVAQWNSTGNTVAGDAAASSGIASNRLNFPYGLKFDSSNALYITDYNNNRIQKWIAGASNGSTVAGQINGASGQSSTFLYGPVGLVLDSNDNMYFSDRANCRVMFWANGASSGSTIAGTGIGGSGNNQLQNPSMIEYVPSTNVLYIADTMNHRIMKYLLNASSGTVVAGGNGQGLSNTQLSKPYGMALDLSTNSLIICNYAAHTVVRWILGANSWTLIAGSSGVSGSSATLLYQPVGVTLDHYGNIYVADAGNHRIQCFLVGHSAGITIAGVTGSPGISATQLNAPFGLILDNQLNLYVADTANNRVQKFARY